MPMSDDELCIEDNMILMYKNNFCPTHSVSYPHQLVIPVARGSWAEGVEGDSRQ